MEKDTKSNSRHILSLDLRAQAIREYNTPEPKTTIQALANKYNVSFRQMHGIISNRTHILKSYEEEFDVKRQEKIEFLGKVMYEYIQRAMQQSVALDDDNVLQKAKEIAQCMAVLNFEITHSWLNDFKNTYGIPNFDLKTLRENLTFMEAKRGQLNTCELIAYVGHCESKTSTKNIWCEKLAPSDTLESLESATITSPDTMPESNNNPVIKSDAMSTESDFECKPLTTTIISIESKPEVTTIKSDYDDSSMSLEIKSVDEALRHIRLLEEFAMLQDNYRAIGLLTQLEKVFKETVRP